MRTDLTEEQKQAWATDGYLVLPNVLDTAEVMEYEEPAG